MDRSRPGYGEDAPKGLDAVSAPAQVANSFDSKAPKWNYGGFMQRNGTPSHTVVVIL